MNPNESDPGASPASGDASVPPTGAETVAPPVMESRAQRVRREGIPLAWPIFALVILGLMALQLVGYFMGAQEEGAAGVSANVPMSVKMFLSSQTLTERLPKPSSGTEGTLSQVEALKQVETQIKKDGFDDPESARYLAVVQAIQEKEVDAGALEVLRGSESELDGLVLRAVEGDASAAEGLDAQSDDYSERLARGLALKTGGEESPFGGLMSLGEAATAIAGPMMFVVLLGGGIIVLIGWGIYVGTGGVKPAAGFPAVPLDNWSADLSGLRAAAFLVLYFVGGQGVLAVVLMQFNVDVSVMMVASQVFGLAALLGLAAFRTGDLAPRLGEMIRGDGSVLKLMLGGFLGYLANFPLFLAMVLISRLLMSGLPEPSHAVTEALGEPSGFLTVAVLFVVAAVFAPFLEEVVFRGWLLRGLVSRTGKVWLSIVISGVTFAVIHPQGPMLYGALAVIGMMGAFLTYRTGSLIPAITMHALHNATILTIAKTMFA